MDDLVKRIQNLDLVAEQRLLSMKEWNERLEVEKNLENLYFLEDLQWKQKARKIEFCKGIQILSFSISLPVVGEGKIPLPILNLKMGK